MYVFCHDGRPELPIRFQPGSLVHRVNASPPVVYEVLKTSLGEDDTLRYVLNDSSSVRAEEIALITDG